MKYKGIPPSTPDSIIVMYWKSFNSCGLFSNLLCFRTSKTEFPKASKNIASRFAPGDFDQDGTGKYSLTIGCPSFLWLCSFLRFQKGTGVAVSNPKSQYSILSCPNQYRSEFPQSQFFYGRTSNAGLISQFP